MFNHEIFDYSNAKNPILSVIITFRSNDKYDMIDRINFREYNEDDIEFVIVDDGSNKFDSERAKELCKNKKFKFIRINSESVPFSAGRARNLGVVLAKGKYIVHEDIDLYPLSGYYDQVLKEIKLQKLKENCSDFISIPVYYLTETASSNFFQISTKDQKDYIVQALNEGTKGFFSFCMPASSVIIVNRYHYLSLGGYDESFTKWGLEDLDYAYRLTRSSNKFHTARAYREFVTNPPFAKQTEYKGWRVQFRMFGEACYRKGLFLVHIHHPIDNSWRNKSAHLENLSKFTKNIEEFEKNNYFLPALPAPENGRTLMFGKGCFVYNRKIFPIWGEVVLKSYEYFIENDIQDYVRENGISRIVFTNPYASETRRSVYEAVKKYKIPFYVVERGALRDSIFVDKTGFCCESTLYQEKYWNHEITEEKRKLVNQYILNEQTESGSLEKQSSLLGARRIREKLGINSFEKVIFVALQSRSDTTTNFFAGKIGSYDNFVAEINKLADLVSSKWRIVVKHHPLSKVKEDFSEKIIIADDANIKDLLSLADYVVTMNSGVGVLAVIFKKPVIHMSHAFYRSDLLNRYASSAEEILELINKGFIVSQESVERFISYLINDFYCFGRMKTRNNENYTDKARMTVTTGIDYYKFSVDNVNYFNDTRVSPIDYDSPLYDPFRADIVKTIAERKNKATVRNNSPKPVVENKKAEGNNTSQKQASRAPRDRRKLWEKFKNNPKKYCQDSKYRIIRLFGKLF